MKQDKPGIFLSAEWRKLLMVNYEINPELLLPYVPKHTELDLYNGKCLISLVGFMFLNTRILGISFPYHRNFEEFNLRFYVKYKQNGVWKRGAVFISEIVPKYAIPIIANTIYRENYVRLPIRASIHHATDELSVSYAFKTKARWHTVSVKAEPIALDIKSGSIEDFITEHYWGYNKWNSKSTLEYGVEHPTWQCYPVKEVSIDCDFKHIYPPQFIPSLSVKPHSTLLAEGSEIVVRKGIKLLG